MNNNTSLSVSMRVTTSLIITEAITSTVNEITINPENIKNGIYNRVYHTSLSHCQKMQWFNTYVI